MRGHCRSKVPFLQSGPRCRYHCCRYNTAAVIRPQAALNREVGSTGIMQDVQKPRCDRRHYKHATLPNGVRVLAVQDTDAVFAAACANVQAGYFDDTLPGAAHFLEHMVHLGSETYPDDKEYKAFLAANGGSSNASTGMVHTRYHFKVHSSALSGALSRLGAALSCPLISQDCASREVENVHAEYSRNTNSDSRKLLQLQRSLCQPPYSGFSTGSIKTLWEEPQAAGLTVSEELRQLWQRCYCAEATTVAVVGPQEPALLLQWVEEAFGSLTSSSDGSSHRPHTALQGTSCSGHLSLEDDLLGGAEVAHQGHCSVTSSEDESDTDAAGAATAGGTAVEAAAAAAVHAKADQGPSEPGSEDEACSEIAAPQEHGMDFQRQQQPPQQKQQHGGNSQQLPQQQQQRQRHRYPVDVVAAGSAGQLLLISPQRDLRELELTWYIPCGAMAHSSMKPWHWASHLLGHEVPGSVAHLLKAQGLVQSLSVGMGDEVRLGRGWMFWHVTMQLTQEGEQQVEHVVATVFRGVQMLRECSNEQLQRTWQEAATLAQLRFDWKDQPEPLAAAQAAAYALHYYPPAQALSGPALMTHFDPAPLRWFVEQLTPASVNIFWSSRRHAQQADMKEPFYGAQYTVQPLPAAWLDRIAQYQAVDAGLGSKSIQQQPEELRVDSDHQQCQATLEVVAGQLYLPPSNWAIPTDFSLRQDLSPQATQDSAESGQHVCARAGANGANGADTPAAQLSSAVTITPQLMLDQPGLCLWHKLDTSFGLPKVHLKLHLVTAAVYETPAATVAARLLVRVLEDVLLPLAYPAELAGSSFSLSTDSGGLRLGVVGFPGVAQQLLLEVLQALKGLTLQQVQRRFSTMSGRLTQGLTNWRNNNPAQHSEYAAHHLLLQHHHHNKQLLAAASTTTPSDLLQLQHQLVSGRAAHIDMLCYGNISRQEATQLAEQVQQVLKPQGLPPGSWPPLGRVLCLSPHQSTPKPSPTDTGVSDSTDGSSVADKSAGEGPQVTAIAGKPLHDSPVYVTYLPDNPNPSNSNHAVYYLIQLGPDDVATSIMLDLFVQLSSKAAFHELRTRQRLGYSVHLSSSILHRQLGLVIRVQSPSTRPDAIAAAIRAWLAGFRLEVQGMAQEKLDSHKQALLGRYLEPAKSLREAARRAWAPIGSTRTLVFDRRQQKADLIQTISLQQLLQWFDDHVHPEAPGRCALCVHVWGGVVTAPDELCAATAQQAQPSTVTVVLDHQWEAFKQCQSLLPLPEVQLPKID